MKRAQITTKKQAKKISSQMRQRKVKEAVQVIETHPNNFISTNEALKTVKEIGEMNITLKTLITWVVTYKMGRKIGGRWVIYKSMFLKFLREGSKSV